MEESCSKSKTAKQGNSSNSEAKAPKTQKKPRKRVKGQKDIRTLIKAKKNELVTYSKDFDLICKQSGIDVDSEQLQLAIALSKSLQNSETVNSSTTNTEKSLTSNQRKGRIRTTLQEYGFKVPDIKYSKPKKVKKYRKPYKLLLATDIEKQEKIANKYAQILFTNVSISSLNKDYNNTDSENTTSFLYHISTNILYECIKNDAIFYVHNLVEIPLTEKHHTLRDWSEIPGRPNSPKQEISSDINFKSIECSQEELTDILSGTIETTQKIVKGIYCSNKLSISSSKENNTNSLNINTYEDPHVKDTYSNSLFIEIKHNLIENISDKSFITNRSIFEETITMPPPTNRSCSPDIFDDEVTIIMDTTKEIVTLQDDLSDRPTVREQIDYMDLTECVNVLNCNTTYFNKKSCLSQENNKTRMNPNDFMELTGCVTACSQKNVIHTENENFIEKENCSPNVIKKKSQEDVMDLTQSSKSSDSSQNLNEVCDKKSLDDTVIVVSEDFCNFKTSSNLDNLTPKGSDIIDLVEGDHILNNSLKHNFLQNPEEDENGKKETNYSDSRNDQICDYLDTDNTKKSCESYLAEDNKDKDAMDLTQSSNSEDDQCYVQVPECFKNDHVDITSKEETNKDLIEIKLHSTAGSNCNDDNQDHYRELSPYMSPAYMRDYDDYYRFDSPLNNIPLNSSNSPDHNKSEDQNHLDQDQVEKNQAMDLTHSHSDDSVQIVHDISGVKSLDDTIVLNDQDYNSQNLGNEIKAVEIDPVNKENSTPCENENKLISQNKTEITMNENFSKNDNDIVLTLKTHIANENHDSFQINICVDKEQCNVSKFCNGSDIIITSPNNLKRHLVSNIDDRDSISTNLYDKYNINNNSDDENREIDLTQHSDGAEDIYKPEIVEVPDGIREISNISIDYDNYVPEDKESEIIVINHINDHENFIQKEKSSSIDGAATSSSQNTAVFEISDDEFNYSINQHKEDDNSVRLDRTRFNIGGASVIDEFLNRNSLSISKLRCSCSSNSDPNSNQNKINICLPEISYTSDNNIGSGINRKSKSCTEINSVKVSSPSKSMSSENILFAQTPKHNDYIIKTDVTPMPNYEMMTSPERNEALDRFGIKPLKRKRAIQILTHIYDQTHPVMEVVSENEDYSSPSKLRKRNEHTSFPRRVIASQIDLVTSNYCMEPAPSLQVESLSQKSSKSCVELSKNSKKSPQNTVNVNEECNLYEETKQLPDIRNIECCPEDWVFQKREKAKVHSCRVPLHIAFHNYVSCRQALREAILKYEPINIDDIHKGLVATGYRYNPKDLLKFMDKKCITVKTAESNRQNKK